MNIVLYLARILVAAASDNKRLALENIALRHQLAVLNRSVNRPRIDDNDRVFWIFLKRVFKDWAEHLIIVKPETVVRWHRKGFAYYWARKSRRTPGRPPIPMTVVLLIKRLSRENPLWGAPRIQAELALLSHDVAERTVSKYMVRTAPEHSRQTWRTFFGNHMDVAAACDFFTVPTVNFKVLYVFVVLSHGRRRIEHVNATFHPTAEWTAQQIVEAFPGDRGVPRYLHRDNDGIYGAAFRNRVRALGIEEVRSARACPWQNPFIERVIGSIRRECTDHIVAMREKHVTRLVREYADYYNAGRCHQGLEGNSPVPRAVGRTGEINGEPVLGGLHNVYRRVA